MTAPRRGEVWLTDMGIAGKVRPCLLLTDHPAEDELALITVVPPHHCLERQSLGGVDSQAVSQARCFSSAAASIVERSPLGSSFGPAHGLRNGFAREENWRASFSLSVPRLADPVSSTAAEKTARWVGQGYSNILKNVRMSL